VDFQFKNVLPILYSVFGVGILGNLALIKPNDVGLAPFVMLLICIPAVALFIVAAVLFLNPRSDWTPAIKRGLAWSCFGAVMGLQPIFLALTYLDRSSGIVRSLPGISSLISLYASLWIHSGANGATWNQRLLNDLFGIEYWQYLAVFLPVAIVAARQVLRPNRRQLNELLVVGCLTGLAYGVFEALTPAHAAWGADKNVLDLAVRWYNVVPLYAIWAMLAGALTFRALARSTPVSGFARRFVPFGIAFLAALIPGVYRFAGGLDQLGSIFSLVGPLCLAGSVVWVVKSTPWEPEPEGSLVDGSLGSKMVNLNAYERKTRYSFVRLIPACLALAWIASLRVVPGVRSVALEWPWSGPGRVPVLVATNVQPPVVHPQFVNPESPPSRRPPVPQFRRPNYTQPDEAPQQFNPPVQQNTAPEPLYQPQASDFQSVYQSDAADQQLQSFDDYFGWVQTFYSHWTESAEEALSYIKDPNAKNQVTIKINQVGRLIAGEWAKDRSIKKISTFGDLPRYNSIMQQGEENEDGSGRSIDQAITEIGNDATANIRS
jgi:hypothetical protein